MPRAGKHFALVFVAVALFFFSSLSRVHHEGLSVCVNRWPIMNSSLQQRLPFGHSLGVEFH